MVPCLQLYGLTEVERSLEEIMDAMGQYAQSQGLTENTLQPLLESD
jgi:DNA-binding HxlR family transcriptional regulator